MTSYVGSGQPDDPQNRPEKAALPPLAGGYTTPPTGDQLPPPDSTLPPPPPDPTAPPVMNPPALGATPAPPGDHAASPPQAAAESSASTTSAGQPSGPTPAESGGPGGPGGASYPPAGPYGAPASYPPVVPSAPAKGGGAKIALIVGAVVLAVVLVCCLAGVVAFFAARPGDPAPGPKAATGPSISPRQVEPGANAYNLHELNKGDCLVNDGTDQNASLREVPCGPNTYEVLAIIPFNSDTEKCWDSPLGDPKTEFTFVYDGATDIEDYVLCLKQR